MSDKSKSELNMDAMVQAIKKGAAVGSAVAEARPTWPKLGHALLTLHAELVESVWEGDGGKRAVQRPLQPLDHAAGHSPGTPNLNSNNELVLQVASTSVTAVRDHLLGFANLCASDGPERTLIVVSRVLLDASAHVLWLLDPAVDEQARTIRSANVWFESIGEEIKDPIAATEKQTLSRRRDDLLQAAITDGFQPVYTQRGARRHQLSPAHSQPDVLTAALSSQARNHWRAASSVVHAQERSHLRFELGTGAIDPGPHATSMLMGHSMIVMTLIIQAIERIEEFYGVVGSPVSDKTVKRVFAVGAFGSGMRDDVIRRHLALS